MRTIYDTKETELEINFGALYIGFEGAHLLDSVNASVYGNDHLSL